MKDITSFETTKKLLEAGFPRSEDWGTQYWIDDEPTNLSGFASGVVAGGSVLGNGSTKKIRASSALDILKVLGTGYVIEFLDEPRCWYCYYKYHPFESKTININPAEAAAEMYLKVNS